MNDAERELEALGEHVRDGLGEPLDDVRRTRQRMRLVETATPSTSRHRWRVVSGAVGLTATVAIVLLLAWPRTSLEVRGTQVGRWVDTSHPTPSDSAWRFSDGSSVQLERDTRARLELLEGREVRVVVAEGSVVSEVEPTTHARWQFEAGPYVVTVLGTRLGVRWSSASGRLEVPVWRGRVAVEGGQLGGRRLEVGAGERLVVDGDSVALHPVAEAEPTAQRDPATTEATTEPAIEPTAPSDPSTSGRESTASTSRIDDSTDGRTDFERASTRSRSHASSDPTARFRALAHDGRHREALDALGAPTRLLTRGNAEELVLLGDTARLAGDGALAERAFATTRERFAGSPEAAAAAFRLARIRSTTRRHGDAARWYEIYVREAPSGPLAAQARGRAVEAWQRAGDVVRAREAAQAYRAAHPSGPYRALAEEVLRAP